MLPDEVTTWASSRPLSGTTLAIVRRSDGRFLLVNEPAGIARGVPRYWLPAGRVDAGEERRTGCSRVCSRSERLIASSEAGGGPAATEASVVDCRP